MTPANTILFGGIAGILALDTVSATAAKFLKFPYKYSMVGSVAIYLAVGWYTALLASDASPGMAAALVGAAESTLGWWIAWHIGPGKSPTMKHMKAQVIVALFGGALIAAGVGIVGAWAARRWG
jgi:hypothetical protein